MLTSYAPQKWKKKILVADVTVEKFLWSLLMPLEGYAYLVKLNWIGIKVFYLGYSQCIWKYLFQSLIVEK